MPETWFYRDADAFRHSRVSRRNDLAGRGNALPLRILSLPCSTGEEPYTIAMTLLDWKPDAAQLRIDAMDISERSLAVAQRAEMPPDWPVQIRFRQCRFPFRDAHFARTEDGCGVSHRASSKRCVSRANLMQLDASTLGVYDNVFCRNVLIYIDRDAQQKALQAAHRRHWPVAHCSSVRRKLDC